MGKYAVDEKKETILCDRCSFEMSEITACHLICNNCGSHKDCSEKSSW